MVETDNPVDNACIDSDLGTEVKQRSANRRNEIGTAKNNSENKTKEKVIIEFNDWCIRM